MFWRVYRNLWLDILWSCSTRILDMRNSVKQRTAQKRNETTEIKKMFLCWYRSPWRDDYTFRPREWPNFVDQDWNDERETNTGEKCGKDPEKNNTKRVKETHTVRRNRQGRHNAVKGLKIVKLSRFLRKLCQRIIFRILIQYYGNHSQR